jgi:hypothetical protein
MAKYKEAEKEHQEEMIRDENLRIRVEEIKKVEAKIREVQIGKRGDKSITGLHPVNWNTLQGVQSCDTFKEWRINYYDYSPFFML